MAKRKSHAFAVFWTGGGTGPMGIGARQTVRFVFLGW